MKKMIKCSISILIFFQVQVFGSVKAYNQIEIDTIPISETQLNDRHVSYIYDFAFNSAMHQYRSLMPLRTLEYQFPNKSNSTSLLVLRDVMPTNISDLELFIFPDSTKHFYSIKNTQKKALNNKLISQFDLKYLPSFNKPLKDYFPLLMELIKENNDIDFAVGFSDLYMIDNLIYVFLGITFNGNVADYLPGTAHIFEFEWCENKNIVYPRRVSAPNFHKMNRGVSPSIKLGGTIDIPSLKCN